MRAIRLALGVLACGVVGVGAATGQVAPVQTGRNLDVNLRVGSGGVNSVVRSTRLDSQLFVSGQVTGLGGFHGSTGYVASNELRVLLPSEEFDGFRARSVGVGQIARGGGTFRAEAYYRRTVTVLGVDDLVLGRGAVGSNMPRTSRGAPAVVDRLYREAVEGHTGLMDSPMGRGAATRQSGAMRYGPLTGSPGGAGTVTGGADWPVAAPARVGMFTRRDREDLAKELYDLHRVDAGVEALVDASVDARVDGLPGQHPAAREDGLPPLPGQPDEPNWTRGSRPTDGMPRRDEDVFLDLLMRLREQRAGGAAVEAPQARPRKGTDEPIVQLSDRKTILLRGIAGKGRDLFNLHMKRARRHLQAGKFYEAVAHYELAAAANAQNPLAQMGLCVAYFCAGEPLTASLHLRRSFAMFPALMRTRIDIKTMMGAAVLRYRLGELDRRAENEAIKTERMLALLLAFMHRNAGNSTQAANYARTLQRIAKDDKVLVGYATFILTGQIPPDKASGGKMPK